MDSTSPAAPPAALGPGFRFHPSDEELVQYYLKRKVCGKAIAFDAIADVDIYKKEPWNLGGGFLTPLCPSPSKTLSVSGEFVGNGVFSSL